MDTELYRYSRDNTELLRIQPCPITFPIDFRNEWWHNIQIMSGRSALSSLPYLI